MVKWDSELYKTLVENTKDPILQEIMKREMNHIQNEIREIKQRTFIEAGAGTGRVIPFLSRLAKEVVAVEIDDQMIKELKRRTVGLKNVTVIQGDVAKLDTLLKKHDIELNHPVVLSLLNTLGTAKGNPYKMLDGMKRVAQEYGELLITLFCKYSLKEWGLDMYGKLEPLVGKVDYSVTDFQKGIFKSEVSYSSRWWGIEDIVDFCSKLETQPSITLVSPYFWMLHADYFKAKSV